MFESLPKLCISYSESWRIVRERNAHLRHHDRNAPEQLGEIQRKSAKVVHDSCAIAAPTHYHSLRRRVGWVARENGGREQKVWLMPTCSTASSNTSRISTGSDVACEGARKLGKRGNLPTTPRHALPE